MYFCPSHNWSSLEQSCPSCVTLSTGTTDEAMPVNKSLSLAEIKQTLQSLIDKRLEAMPKYYEGMKSDLDTSEVNDLFLTGVKELVGRL